MGRFAEDRIHHALDCVAAVLETERRIMDTMCRGDAQGLEDFEQIPIRSISGNDVFVAVRVRVRPVFKNGDTSNINNYRPISILPSIIKNL